MREDGLRYTHLTSINRPLFTLFILARTLTYSRNSINRQRAQEMWNWIYQLESEKFDLLDQMKRQKYEVCKSCVYLGQGRKRLYFNRNINKYLFHLNRLLFCWTGFHTLKSCKSHKLINRWILLVMHEIKSLSTPAENQIHLLVLCEKMTTNSINI